MYPETILQWIGAVALVFGVLSLIGAFVWLLTGPGRRDNHHGD